MAIHRQIDLLKLAGGAENLQKVDNILNTIADADTTYLPAVLEYAEFLRYRDGQKSLKYYLIYQRGCNNSINSYIDGTVRLSDAYYKLRMFDKNEALLDEALRLTKENAKNDTLSEEYLNVVAQIYSQQAQLYSNEQVRRYEEAKVASEKAIKALELLSEIDSLEYMSQYGQALKIAGDNYNKTNNTEIAKEYMTRAVAKFAFLNEEEPDKYETKYAWALSSLASIFKHQKDTVNAISNYDLAIELYGKAMKRDPEVYEIFYARSLHNAASLHETTEERLNIYLSCGKIFDKYYNKSTTYLYEYLICNNNISDLYASLDRYTEAIEHSQTFLRELEKASQSRPQTYQLCLGNIYYILAYCYSKTGQMEDARIYALKTIETLSPCKRRRWCENFLQIPDNQQ